MLFAFATLGFLVFVKTNEYLKQKIVLEPSHSEVAVDSIPFPAVTICPQLIEAEYLPFDVDTNDKWVKENLLTLQ
jgi:hypothetical protein